MHSFEYDQDPFNALEAPKHRSQMIENGLYLLANNPAVRDALTEQEATRIQESQANVVPVDFQNHRIVSLSEKDDLERDARRQIDDIAA